MRKKRVMIIGAGKSGKSTIAGWLDGIDELPKKVANIRYGPRTIDIPGGYLECPWMHRHLIDSANDALCILMLVDQSRCRNIYPPGFAKAFRAPVLGVITKSDLDLEKRALCEQQLKQAGVQRPYYNITAEKDSFQKIHGVIMKITCKKGGTCDGYVCNENKDIYG